MRLVCILIALVVTSPNMAQTDTKSIEELKEQIDTTLIAWHKAAADVDFKKYFSYISNDGVYLGTDASENWTLAQFKAFAKPHFDKGKAWSFTTLQRNIYLNDQATFAWFDEHLDTWMGICRGSGVLALGADGSWKIKHYVLSLAIPNPNIKPISKLNRTLDSVQKSLWLDKN